MKIYTKKGDLGETSLVGGRRISKDDLQIDSYGTVDELNSWIGLLADVADEHSLPKLRTIQNTLFKVGSILANDAEHPFDLGFDIVQSDVELLEQWIDKMDGQLEPLKNFILPGGHTSVSHAQIARTVCRRAERLCVALNKVISLNPLVIMYLNRLSDLLFTYARYLSKTLGAAEIVWKV